MLLLLTYTHYLLAILASSLRSTFPTREQGCLTESYDQARGNVKNSGYLGLMALRTALVSSRSCEAGVHAAQLATE